MLNTWIGGKYFRTKTELKRYVDAIRKADAPNTPLSVLDEEFVLEAIKTHPKYFEVAPRGIAGCFRGCNNQGQPHLVLKYRDGTCEPFSAKRLGDDPDLYKIQKVSEAFRQSIKEQVSEYRNQRIAANTYFSDISGVEDDYLDVDHYGLAFYEIREMFLASKGIELADVAIVPIEFGNVSKSYVLAAPLLEEWAEFHRTHAKLRLTTTQENLELAAVQSGEWRSRKKKIREEFDNEDEI